MSSATGSLILTPGGGEFLAFKGVTTRIKVGSETTNGVWTLLESTIEPHFGGFKFHTHQRTIETFYMLEGTLRFQLDEQTIDVGSGSMLVITPGTWHTYSNPTDVSARYLLLVTPGGFEKFLEGLAEMLQAEAAGTPIDTAKLNALAAQYDATVG
jgi:quercetin dioxygenase-like cupin family protein